METIKKGLYVGGFAFFYMIVSIILYMFTNHGLSVWLGFNVILALIPVGLVILMKDYLKQKDQNLDVIVVILFIIFVFFLPNSFYIVTDFIHLQSVSFYYQEIAGYTINDIYFYEFSAYLLLIHIFISSVIGVIAFVYSFKELHSILESYLSKVYQHILLIGLMFLSSIGIYIGRFLRFFSWDILNPIHIIKQLYADFSGFMISFVLLFTVVQIIVYYGYVFLKDKKLL